MAGIADILATIRNTKQIILDGGPPILEQIAAAADGIAQASRDAAEFLRTFHSGAPAPSPRIRRKKPTDETTEPASDPTPEPMNVGDYASSIRELEKTKAELEKFALQPYAVVALREQSKKGGGLKMPPKLQCSLGWSLAVIADQLLAGLKNPNPTA